MVTLEMAKEYLKVDSSDEDETIEILLKSAVQICADVARMNEDEFSEVGEIGKAAVLFALGYFYEHREEGDRRELILTLRALLFGVRREGF